MWSGGMCGRWRGAGSEALASPDLVGERAMGGHYGNAARISDMGAYARKIRRSCDGGKPAHLGP